MLYKKWIGQKECIQIRQFLVWINTHDKTNQKSNGYNNCYSVLINNLMLFNVI